MHFLIDASLPRSAGAVLKQLGHEATDVRDVGMREEEEDLVIRDRVVGPVDAVIPVDGYVPGCPPTPAMLLTGILQVLQKTVSSTR